MEEFREDKEEELPEEKEEESPPEPFETEEAQEPPPEPFQTEEGQEQPSRSLEPMEAQEQPPESYEIGEAQEQSPESFDSVVDKVLEDFREDPAPQTEPIPESFDTVVEDALNETSEDPEPQREPTPESFDSIVDKALGEPTPEDADRTEGTPNLDGTEENPISSEASETSEQPENQEPTPETSNSPTENPITNENQPKIVKSELNTPNEIEKKENSTTDKTNSIGEVNEAPLQKTNELNNQDDLAYLIGALGDGSIYHNEQYYVHRVSYYQSSKEYLEKCIESRILNIFGKKGHFYFDQRNGVYFYEITRKKIYETIKGAAGPFKDKKQPNIPDWILNGTDGVRRSFVRGFFDAEGFYYIKPNASDYRVRFGQADRSILEGVRNILIVDGFKCSAVLGPYQSKLNVKPYYELHIHGRSQVERFHELIKPSHPNKRVVMGLKE